MCALGIAIMPEYLGLAIIYVAVAVGSRTSVKFIITYCYLAAALVYTVIALDLNHKLECTQRVPSAPSVLANANDGLHEHQIDSHMSNVGTY